MTAPEADDLAGWIEITGDLDRPAAEALRLELLRLAREHDLEIEDLKLHDDEA